MTWLNRSGQLPSALSLLLVCTGLAQALDRDCAIAQVHQNWSFGIACLIVGSVVVGLLLLLLLRWRLRQLVARERMRHEVRLRERERITSELHDALLQGTQGFVLKVQAAANQMAHDDHARLLLDDALETADQVMTQGRDRIQHLRTLGVDACLRDSGA